MSGHLREHRDNRFQQFYPAGVVRLGHHLHDSHRVERGGGLHRGATSVRVEPSLIDGRSTAGAFGDVSRLRLCSAQELIGKLGVSLGQIADDLKCHGQVDVNVQGGVHVQVQVNVNVI